MTQEFEVKKDVQVDVSNEPVDTDPTPIDEDDPFAGMELGSIDPESYQEQEDDGCEGGACKI